MTVTDKRDLRARLRSLHQGMAERDRQSLLTCRAILESDLYRGAKVIAGYMPLPRELDVRPVLADVLSSGRTLVLPRCGRAPCMTLHRVEQLSQLVSGPYDLLEPTEDMEIIPLQKVELMLVPLEGIDHSGFRLGKGGGYYDYLLQQADVPTLGCALSWQWVQRVPCQAWDHPLDACADWQGIHCFD